MKAGDQAFVDTGAWVALAVTTDPLHSRAKAAWEDLLRVGPRLVTSVPVVLETFTFLDRRGSRELALRWEASLATVRRLELVSFEVSDLPKVRALLANPKFHRLSFVDATSFVLMKQRAIRRALAFDVHFAVAGFSCIG